MRLGRLFFATSFLIIALLSLAGIILSTSNVFAQAAGEGVNGDKVGPELAFFDPGGQKRVNDNILVPNGFTGTTSVLNDIHAAPYNPAPGTKARLRIVNIHGSKIAKEDCNDKSAVPTTIGEVENFARALNSHPDFDAGTVVMFGNELNNLQKEFCYSSLKNNAAVMQEAGRDYARLLKAFAAVLDHGPGKKFILVPTSLDPNNPEYSAKQFLQGIKSAGGYDVVDALAQSVFDVPPAPDLDGDITPEMVAKIPNGNRNLATYLVIEQLTGKKVVYFNGWGSQPALSVRKQVDWLLTTPLPSDIPGAATLIANNCGGKKGFAVDDWLFFVNGKVFNVEGQELNPDTCAVSDSSLKSIYIYPGIEEERTSPEKLKKAAEYMLTCGPRLTFAGQIENEDKINTPSPGFQPIPLDCSGPGSCIIPEVAGFAYVNHEETTIPLYRFQNATIPNVTTPQRRLDDLEGFFSARYKGGADQYTNFVGNGTSTNLTSVEASCQRTLDYLHSIQNLCNNDNQATVAINNKELKSSGASSSASAPSAPASGTTLRCALDLDLPGAETTYLTTFKNKPDGFTCTWNPDVVGPEKAKIFQEYQGKLALIENTTPKAFKPAYIVHYVDQPVTSPTILDKLENWLTPQGDSPEEQLGNRVKVTKVYVPAGFAASNTDSPGLVDKSIKTTFTGGFMGTMLALTPTETINKITEKIKTQTDEVFSKSSASNMTNPDPFLDKFLSCPECDSESFVSTLVKRINAEVVRTADLGDENLDCYETDLAGEKASEKKQTINPEGTNDPVIEISMPARATLKAKGSIGKKVSLRTYFLLPQEYKNVFEYEKFLASSLFPAGYADSLNFTAKSQEDTPEGGKPAYKYLQLSDTAPKFGRSGKTVHMSSAEREGEVIGFNVSSTTSTPAPGQTTGTTTTSRGSAVNLKGRIVSADTNSFDINPLTPGGKLARGLWELVCHAIRPPQNTDYAPYQGFEKILQRGSAACFVEKNAPKCEQPDAPTLTQVGKGWQLSVPAKAENFITSAPGEYGQRTCDWAKGKDLSFAINANFGYNSTTPIGPFGFAGNITNAPIKSGQDTMSLMIDKSGKAAIYDWFGRNGSANPPDISQAQFIVTGVYYDNFKDQYAGALPRTLIGLKDGNVIIRTFIGDIETMRKVMMDDLKIPEGQFFSLDGDSVTQMCQVNSDGSVTEVYPASNTTLPESYPVPVAVSMGIKGGSGEDCPDPATACKVQHVELSCNNYRPGAPHDDNTWVASNSEAETACSPSGASAGTGQKAVITSEVVQLALKVSDATCMPAEAIIGVMAKETSGIKDSARTPFGGDPMELYVYKDARKDCGALDIHDRNSPGYYNFACGPFSYTQANMTGSADGSQKGQIAAYGAAIKPCLESIGIDLPDADLDTRLLGVSMCTAAANMWRGTTFSASRACDGRGRTLNELSFDELRNGVMVYHGDPNNTDGSWINYRSFIDQYKYFVGKVRAELISCN